MKETSDLIACVVDHGLFLPIGQKLSETYKHVYYWSPWEEAYSTRKKGMIGDGYDNITRVDSIWEVKKDCDLFVFPDIGFSAEQAELISQGFPVWGARDADSLEMMRGKFLKVIESLGLPMPKYKEIEGITKLREYLREREDKWIKASKWRGDIETWHWRDWAHDESTLDFYAYKLGPTKDKITFYVLDPIDTDIEDGMDTFCIDGKMPNLCMHGMEAKDKSYLCTMAEVKDIPEQVRMVAEKFAPVLAEYGYRSFLSTEVRVKDDESYFIDPTLRCGSPPSQVMTELFSNLGEIIWQGANGDCIDPESTAKFGVQALITSNGSRDAWEEVEIPDDIKQWVKAGCCCQIDGKLCSPPDEHKSNDIGWLCAIGDTIEESIETLKEYAGKLPDGLECDLNSLADLITEVKSAEDHGMEFTDDTVPEPSIVLANGD